MYYVLCKCIYTIYITIILVSNSFDSRLRSYLAQNPSLAKQVVTNFVGYRLAVRIPSRPPSTHEGSCTQRSWVPTPFGVYGGLHPAKQVVHLRCSDRRLRLSSEWLAPKMRKRVKATADMSRRLLKLIHIYIFLSIFGLRFWYMNRNLFGRFMFRYGSGTGT